MVGSPISACLLLALVAQVATATGSSSVIPAAAERELASLSDLLRVELGKTMVAPGSAEAAAAAATIPMGPVEDTTTPSMLVEQSSH